MLNTYRSIVVKGERKREREREREREEREREREREGEVGFFFGGGGRREGHIYQTVERQEDVRGKERLTYRQTHEAIR